ncbi:MAG: hypothetical protein IPN76_15115 [Saprospiraceae bacterium]|nr:hypothetical protein [Saprospiraceae bacterium]
MKKIFSFSLLLSMFCLASLTATGQNIAVTGADPATNAASPFATLAAAFTSINATSQTGNNIAITVINNTTEPGAGAVLNAGTWTSMSIQPSGGASRTIDGNVAGPLIDLNGADNVVIDGLNTGGNSLTISNTNTSNVTTSTIRFINDATVNTVTNCSVLGSSTSLTLGTIVFSTAAVTGNDDNTVSNCTIDAAGVNLPGTGIYSSGTLSFENSGNIINNNNIANFFSAALISYGVFVNNNSTAWTISNNRFYQSALRTYTTANTHRAISIITGNGYTVTGNTIGYANSGGTGVYAMTGTIATRFIGIELAVGTTTATSVQNNTITAITLGTSSGATTLNGILCGINITAGNVNVGTVTGNTIGATTGTGSIVATATTSGGLVVGINCSSTGTIAIQNNSFGALTSSGTTAAIAGSIAGINISGAATAVTITNNTIGNTTANNMRGGTSGLTTGSSLVSGVSMPSTPTTATINNNTIQNLSSFGTGTAGYVRGIHTALSALATATGWSISNNTINSLTTNSALAGLGSGVCSALGIHHLASQGCTISNNTISNIANTNTTATTNIIVVGISSANAAVATALGTTITRNRICDLRNSTIGTTALTPPIVAGIAVRSGNNVVSINNNMVALGTAQTTNTSFIGIWCQNGSTPNPTAMNVQHNSVVIEGTASAGALPSFTFMRSLYISATANTVTVNVNNNIFQNDRTGGTGSHYAISNGFNATTVSATGWAANASNNNVLNANASTIGHWTTAQNMGGWQTISAGDGASLTATTIPFVNVATCDLHVNFGVTPTALESGGLTIAGLTTDFDNDVRPGPTGSVNGAGFLPDLGADEFDGVFLDVVKPAITYTPFLFTCATGDRILTATIADYSGVPTTGALQPRVYFRKNLGTWFSSQGSLSSGTGTNGTWTFTIEAATMGGLVVTDQVQYYVIAQDIAGTPNIGSNPSAGLVATDVNTVTTHPTSPNSYIIGGTLAAGTYTVGAAGTYPTLTAAVNAYNSNCLGGAIVFELLDATYSGSETFPITINRNPDASSTNKLTIRPATGVTAAINGSLASNALIRILGNYIVVDGSNNGTNTRDLTIENANTTAPNVILIGSTGTTAITNDTIKNCILTNGATTSSALVVSDATTLGNDGYFNNIGLVNNRVQRAFIGMYIRTAVLAGNGSGTYVNGNQLNSTGTNAIRLVGIYLQGLDGATVSNNTIGSFDNTIAENDCGVWFATGTVNSTISGNTISTLGQVTTTGNNPLGINITSSAAASNINVTQNTISGLSSNGASSSMAGIAITGTTGGVIVQRNNISGVIHQSTGTWGAYGINVSGGNNNIIRNNFISNINFDMTGGIAFNITDGVCGIRIGAGTGHQIHYNSVNMYGTPTGVANASLLTAAFGILNTTSTGLDVRNNIFANNITGGTTSIAHIPVYLPSGGTSAMNLTWNNNFYFHGTDVATQGVGQAGTTAGVNFYTTLAAQAAYTSTLSGAGTNDNASFAFTTAVPFTSATDLHVPSSSDPALFDKGTPIAGITTDIDNETRAATTPDVAADEFSLITLNLTAFIEGYYTGGSAMNSVLLNSGVMGAIASQCDTITVQLRDGTPPYDVADEFVGILATDGTLTCKFSSDKVGGSYYIALKHRNSLRTWSGAGADVPTSFSTATTAYDFSTAASQAYGNNMVDMGGGVFAIYSGDIDDVNANGFGDGEVEFQDFDAWVADNGNTGYLRADLNGDGEVEFLDFDIWANNNGFTAIVLALP